jgi:hypothetical protein
MNFEEIKEIKKNIYRVCNYGLPSGLFPLKKRDHFKDPGVDGRMILRLAYSGSGMWGHGMELSGGNEPSGSIKCGEFL